MIAWSDISQHDDKTDAEVAAILSADPRLKSDVDADAVEDLLGLGGHKLLYRRNREWNGLIAELVDNPAVPQQLKDGIVWLTGHLDKPGRKIVRTSDATVAGLVWAVLDVIGEPGEVFGAALTDLGGGKRFGTVTEEQVADVRGCQDRVAEIASDDAAVTAAWNEWSNARDAYVRDGGVRPTPPFAGEG